MTRTSPQMIRTQTSNFVIVYLCSVAMSGRQVGSVPSEGSAIGIGHVIVAALLGCVFTVVLFCAALYYRRRRKNFNVSKAEGSSLNDTTSSDHKYSTIARENGVSTRGPPSTSSSTSSKDTIKDKRKKTPSPIKMLRLFRKQHSTAEAV